AAHHSLDGYWYSSRRRQTSPDHDGLGDSVHCGVDLRPGECGDPPDSDSAIASLGNHHAGSLHLRHQRIHAALNELDRTGPGSWVPRGHIRRGVSRGAHHLDCQLCLESGALTCPCSPDKTLVIRLEPNSKSVSRRTCEVFQNDRAGPSPPTSFAAPFVGVHLVGGYRPGGRLDRKGAHMKTSEIRIVMWLFVSVVIALSVL